ncbi:MAG: efflux RND transporter periplasmic adaptor subunit [Immundisolibacteraceae bacterium]|nr:efflux RND transporter periplasmic adaptor subunit [Immundisolibacteraceae bacterium]
MANKRLVSVVLTLLLLGLIMAQMAGLFVTKLPQQLTPLSNSINSVGSAATATVVNTRVPEVVELVGTIQTETEVTIAALVTARIKTITVGAGDRVTEGHLLIRLDNDEFRTRLAQAEQRLAGFQAQLTEAVANFDRIESLYKSQVIARADFDQASAGRTALQASVGQARQAVKEAQINLSYTEITAPVAAQVIERLAEPGDTASVGLPLLTLFNPQRMQLATQVPESMIQHIEVGAPMTVWVEAIDQQISAVVQEIVPVADPGSRSFLVRLAIATNTSIYPGMFARLRLQVASVERIYIPLAAITQVGQIATVEVLVQGQQVRRYIRTGRKTRDAKIEVLSGLRVGERYLSNQPP